MPKSRDPNSTHVVKPAQDHIVEWNLFADTELCEDHSEQIVGRRCARDLPEGLVRKAQLLGKQLSGVLLGQGPAASLEMLTRALHRIHVSAPRGNGLLAEIPVSREPANLSSQRIESVACFRRQPDELVIIVVCANMFVSQINLVAHNNNRDVIR